ncbi:MAG: hypothetical protein D6719_05350 [Candidatus Dadabacteria bacterium]|nr:MAG: hypothetical protein D6719_05350 [Candidatus Dadabacteria bacterium]
MVDKPVFLTKTEQELPGVSVESLRKAIEELAERYGILNLQIAESCSYSMAMVVRFALGLSAQDGQVCVFAADNLCGQIALATLRQLVNAGAKGLVFMCCDPDKASADTLQQLKPLKAAEVNISPLSSLESASQLEDIIPSCHNVLLGLFDPIRHELEEFSPAVPVLNELSTPVHSVQCSYGVNPDTGKPCGEAIFSSSTISLGAPLQGLYYGDNYTGRHYLADISFSSAIYRTLGIEGPALFSEQPVIQIFPKKPEEE